MLEKTSLTILKCSTTAGGVIHIWGISAQESLRKCTTEKSGLTVCPFILDHVKITWQEEIEMKKLDELEKEILDAYEKGDLISSKPSMKEKGLVS